MAALLFSLSEHFRDFLDAASVVTVTAAPVGACVWTAAYVNGFLALFHTGNIDNDDVLSLCFDDTNVIFGEDIAADLPAVVHNVPEVADEPLRVWQVNRVQ